MSRHRRAAKIDKNQNAIVAALLDIPGVTVQVNHDDILCGYQGRTYWYEIKNPDAISKRTGKPQPSKVKPSQVKLRETWTGHYSIVSTLAEILAEILEDNLPRISDKDAANFEGQP